MIVQPSIVKNRLDIITGDDFNLENCMNNFNAISDYELYTFITKNYSHIISEVFRSKNSKYNPLLQSHRFMMTLAEALSDINMTESDQIACNDYIYSAIVYQDIDAFMRKILFSLGEKINQSINTELERIGCLDKELCTFTAITYRSSNKGYLNVKRVNFTLTTSAKKILTAQELMNIYYVLYKNSFTEFFLGTMFDTGIQDAEENGEEWVTETEITINDNITTAVVNLLEIMLPADISRVFRSYYDMYSKQYDCNPNSIRTSIRTICNGDSRFIKIPIILSELEGQGILIP